MPEEEKSAISYRMDKLLRYRPSQAANSNLELEAWEEECQLIRNLRAKRDRVAEQMTWPQVTPEQYRKMEFWLAGTDRVLQQQREMFFKYGAPLV